jgi:hypothetical protein
VGDEVGERLERLVAAQRVGAVEDEDEFVPARDRSLAASSHGGEQGAGVVVRGTERDPRERPRILLRPVQQRRRLAVAGRRGEQDEGDVAGLAQGAHEPRARHQAGTERGAAWRAAHRRSASRGVKRDG